MLQEREWGMPGWVCWRVAVCSSKWGARGGFPEKRTCGAGEGAGSETVQRKGIGRRAGQVPGSGGEARVARAQRRRGGQRGEVGRGACRSLRGESPEPLSGVAGSFWKQCGVLEREATAGVQERGWELCSGRAWRPWGGVVSLVRGTHCPALLRRRAS